MSFQPGIKLTRGSRKGKAIVRIEFPYIKELLEVLKQKTTAVWSANLGCWYIPESNFNLGDFLTALREVAYIDYSDIINESSEDNYDIGRPPKRRHLPDLLSRKLAK